MFGKSELIFLGIGVFVYLIIILSVYLYKRNKGKYLLKGINSPYTSINVRCTESSCTKFRFTGGFFSFHLNLILIENQKIIILPSNNVFSGIVQRFPYVLLLQSSEDDTNTGYYINQYKLNEKAKKAIINFETKIRSYEIVIHFKCLNDFDKFKSFISPSNAQ